MSTPTQINGIRKTIFHLLSGDYDNAADSLKPVVKEKIKARYQQTAKEILSKEGK